MTAELLRRVVATGLGLGLAPYAPGTAGSLGGLLLAWLVGSQGGAGMLLGGTCLVAALGTWAASSAERLFGREDPPCVVVDEIAGQMVSLLYLPLTLRSLLCGFLLFRLLDITKPFPIRWLERLPGGAGIMADDLLAGAYANVLLRAISSGLGDGWISA